MQEHIEIHKLLKRRNSELESRGEKKLTQMTLAKMVLPREKPETARYYIGQWARGCSIGKLNVFHVHRLCAMLNCDANELFNLNKK